MRTGAGLTRSAGDLHAPARPLLLTWPCPWAAPVRQRAAAVHRRRWRCSSSVRGQQALQHGARGLPANGGELVVVRPTSEPASTSASRSGSSRAARLQLLGSTSSLEAASRRELHGLLAVLQAQSDLTAEQSLLAKDLARELDLGRLAPDVLAAALLVVLVRAEGRRMEAAAACRAVRRACGCGQYVGVLLYVRRLEEVWQASQRWRALLGEPVTSRSLTARQAQRVLQRVAAEASPDVATCVRLAARAAAVAELFWDGFETAGNLAGGLLMLASTSCSGSEDGSGSSSTPPCSCCGGSHRQPMGASAAAQAICAAGGEASRTGVLEASRRLEQRREVLGLPAALVPPDPHALRLVALQQLLDSMQAAGELLAGDAELLARLAGSLAVGWSAGVTAAALLVVLGWARGATRFGPAAAAVAVRRAGCKDVHANLSSHLAHLQRHWEASEEWQSLLGPAKSQAVVVAERLATLLRQLPQQGALTPTQLNTVLQLCGDLPCGTVPPHQVGGLAGALLVAAAAARGERLGVARAAAVVQAAGGEAGAKGIKRQLAHLQEHWEQSEAWRQLLGEPAALTPRKQRWQVPLDALLTALAAGGHLDPGQLPALERLVQQQQQEGGLSASPKRHGDFAAALLVASGGARGRQPPLRIGAAVAAVRAAGAAASVTSTWRMLQRILALWEAGDEGWASVLGPYHPLTGSDDSDSLPQLEALLRALCDVGAVQPEQLEVAVRLGVALAQRARLPWRAGNVAGAILIVLAAAEGGQLWPAQAVAAVGAAGGEASPADVFRHKVSAWRLWRRSHAWQLALGGSPLHPPGRTTVLRLLEGLAAAGELPPSQLRPAQALARRLKVSSDEAGAVAAALALGWGRATGRTPSAEAVAQAVLVDAATGEQAPSVGEVHAQLEALQERWGPPSSWASALSQPRGEDQARQGWRQLACLLRELEHAGHLLPGQAAKALYLARTLKVWTGHGPPQKPGNVAAALLLVLAQAPDGRGRLTHGQALAAVRAAGAAASASSAAKWLRKCVRLRSSPQWLSVLGGAPARGGDGIASTESH